MSSEDTQRQVYTFGDKLREVRERRGQTLKDVAGLAHISESMLSQIERNRVSPAIDTLLRLCDVLELDIEYVFSDYRKERQVQVVRAGERKRISAGGVFYEQLSRSVQGQGEAGIEAFLLEIPPGEQKGSSEYGHVGKELGIVLQGQGDFTIGGRTWTLMAGDSISFGSEVPHLMENKGSEPLQAYWIVSPPRHVFPSE